MPAKIAHIASLATLLPFCVSAQDVPGDAAPLPSVAAERPVVMEISDETSVPDGETELANLEAIAGQPFAEPEPASATKQAAATEPAAAMEPAIVEPEGFVPFKCPIERIRDAYQDLVNPEDTLVALAIEKQTLAICRQSQEALILIAENERRLVELFEPIIAPPPPPPSSPAGNSVTAPRTIPAEMPAGEPGQTSEPEFVPPSYQLAAIMKDPQGWKAIVADGGATFAVREGDKMDDGSVVVSIGRGRVELLAPDETGFSLE